MFEDMFLVEIASKGTSLMAKLEDNSTRMAQVISAVDSEGGSARMFIKQETIFQ